MRISQDKNKIRTWKLCWNGSKKSQVNAIKNKINTLTNRITENQQMKIAQENMREPYAHDPITPGPYHPL